MDLLYWQTAGYGVVFPFQNYKCMADFMRRCKGKVMRFALHFLKFFNCQLFGKYTILPWWGWELI